MSVRIQIVIAPGCEQLRPISARKRLSQPPASASLCSTYPALARPFRRCSNMANVTTTGGVPRPEATVFAASTRAPRPVAAVFVAAAGAPRLASAPFAASILLRTIAGAHSTATVVYTATTANPRSVKCCSNAAAVSATVFAATTGDPWPIVCCSNGPVATIATGAAVATIAAAAAAVFATNAGAPRPAAAVTDSRGGFDVFLSFRGTDTRKNFTSHLYEALCREGLKVFLDKEELETGEEIWPALLDAIELSKVSVVVFSKAYASSQWCLSELTKIVECMSTRGQIVVPVFYSVEPREVRRQTGSYGLAFERHDEKVLEGSLMVETVRMQRNALKIVADLSGFSSGETRNEAELVREIVAGVSLRLQNLKLAQRSFLGRTLRLMQRLSLFY